MLLILIMFMEDIHCFREAPYVNLKVPADNPLKYITGETVTGLLLEKLPQSALGYILPVDGTDAIAIFVAEGTCTFHYSLS